MAAPGGPQIEGQSNAYSSPAVSIPFQTSPHLIRHASIVGHCDAGVGTLTQALINGNCNATAASRLHQQIGQAASQEKPTALNRSPVVSLYHEMKDNQRLTPEEVEAHVKRRNQWLPRVQSSSRVAQPTDTNTTSEATSASTASAAQPAVSASEGNTAAAMYGSGMKESLSTLASSAVEGQSAAAPAGGATMDHAVAVPLQPHSETYIINLLSPQTIAQRANRYRYPDSNSWAIRISDGCIICVDIVEGFNQTVLNENFESALTERVRPSLFLNKFDRMILQLQLSGEEFYRSAMRTLGIVNVQISTHVDAVFGDVQLSPKYGNVVFGSALHGFGFSLRTFASLYSSKFGVSISKMMNRLWGESYFSRATKKWTNKSEVNDGSDRGFNLFVYTPFEAITRAAMANNRQILMPMLEKLQIHLPEDNLQLQGKHLLMAILRAWLPLTSNLLEMVCHQLPSPIEAQMYRVANLYTGPQNDVAAHAIRTCDPQGPLCVYIARMIPIAEEKGRFYAFGRVFSGTLRVGEQVRVQGPEHVMGSKKDLFIRPVRSIVSLSTITPPDETRDNGAFRSLAFSLTHSAAGSLIGITSIDQYLVQTGTITDSDETANIASQRISRTPLIQVAVSPVEPRHLPHLMESLKRLSKFDMMVECTTSPDGEHLIGGFDEMHIERCIMHLRNEYLPGVGITVSAPRVSLRESVRQLTPAPCMSKTPNRHSQIYTTAQPFDEECAATIDRNEILPAPNDRARQLFDQWPNDWKDEDETKCIWSFGPENAKSNILVNQTLPSSYGYHNSVIEMKESLVRGFELATSNGCLMEEPMRCVRVNLVDLMYVADAIHRGAGQILPAMKRSIFASQLSSHPCLMQPFYSFQLTVPHHCMATVSDVLKERHATIVTQEEVVQTMGQAEGAASVAPSSEASAAAADADANRSFRMNLHLPALHAISFCSLVRSQTHGAVRCDPTMNFSHWSAIEGDALEVGSVPHQLAMQVRERKGLKPELPLLSNYLDKL